MIITQNGPQNIGQVRTHFQHGNLFLSPVEYQREGVWKADQKGLLIDTVFRRMDIPKFYLWKIDRRTLADGYPEGEARDMYKKVLDRKSQATDDPDRAYDRLRLISFLPLFQMACSKSDTIPQLRTPSGW